MGFEFSIEHIIVTLGYAGIFLLMITNGAVSFPSSQVLYIITGYFIFTGDLSLWLVALIGALGNTIGCIILYELARARGMHYITKFRLFPETIVKKVQLAFQKRGASFVFIGKLVPALKVFVPIPAGIAHMHRGLYIFLIFLSSLIWAAPFIAVGYYFGKSTDVFGKYAIVIAVLALLLLGLFYRYLNSQEIVDEITGNKTTNHKHQTTNKS